MNNFNYLEKLIDEIKNKPDFSAMFFKEFESDPESEILTQVYRVFHDAIKYLNNSCGTQLVSVGHLPADIFRLILNFDRIRACFYLLSKDKYVFVFKENSGQISFFGRYKTHNDKNMKVNHNFVQLFKINSQLINRTIRFKDNTGNEISTDEIIYQILKWLIL